MQKTLADYAQELYKAKGDPGTLSELQIELSAQFGQMTEDYITLKICQASFWNLKDFDENGELRKKPLSDKAIEMMFLRTEDGKKLLKISKGLKSLTNMLGAIKSALWHANTEAKNQY